MFSMFKKKGPVRSPNPRQLNMGDPTERVNTLRLQSLSDTEIIRTLREEGYSPLEVDRAMKNSLRQNVAPQGQQPGMYDQSLPTPGGSMPGEPVPGPSGIEGRRFVFPEDGRPMQRMGGMPEPEIAIPGAPHVGEFNDIDDDLPPIKPIPQKETRMEKKIQHKRELEETVESVVDEKWIEFDRKSGDLFNKLQQLENKINTIEGFVNQLQSQKKSELTEIKGMIDSYKVSMEEITGKMSSLENAMKDSLTPMMQSMRSLSETIKVMRGRKRPLE